ncbi:MAG: hypothetical protein ACXWZT_06150 [Gaiellaceae bacterium]
MSDSNDRGDDVIWWGFGGLFAFLYLVLIFTMGLVTLRKGHWVMFVLGFFLPCSGSSAL